MPAVVGIININSIGTGGVFHVGDVFRISPRTTSKTYSGAGSFNTGEKLYVYNHKSTTNTYDKDVVDQPQAFNV